MLNVKNRDYNVRNISRFVRDVIIGLCRTLVTDVKSSVVVVGSVRYELNPYGRSLADDSLKRNGTAVAGIEQNH